LIDSFTSDQDRLYSEAIASYGSALTRLVVGYEAHAEKRRDLLQEIHIALWTSLANFDGRCSLRTWIYRVGHNVSVNHVIKSKRQNETALVDLEELANVASHIDQTALVDHGNVLDRLRAMIHNLKAPDRQVMLLYLDDVDANSIAQITGVSPINVATKIHRIKQLLARNFHSRGDHV
jgi:RNA polymerase sigma-70 factor, ECF subfamily